MTTYTKAVTFDFGRLSTEEGKEALQKVEDLRKQLADAEKVTEEVIRKSPTFEFARSMMKPGYKLPKIEWSQRGDPYIRVSADHIDHLNNDDTRSISDHGGHYVDAKLTNLLVNSKLLDDDEKRRLLDGILPQGVLKEKKSEIGSIDAVILPDGVTDLQRNIYVAAVYEAAHALQGVLASDLNPEIHELSPVTLNKLLRCARIIMKVHTEVWGEKE
jgi:hypothetical protein